MSLMNTLGESASIRSRRINEMNEILTGDGKQVNPSCGYIMGYFTESPERLAKLSRCISHRVVMEEIGDRFMPASLSWYPR